jgi:asparaginyl-tRNA synthetase
MLEAEIAFVDELEVIMGTLEASLKHVLAKRGVTQCISPKQMIYFDRVANSPWKRITYTEAVEFIQKSTGEADIKWGDSISTEQERWLADTIGEGLPVFITEYPMDMKPFYMRSNSTNGDRRTVACFDLLIPRVGELAGGSMREERLGKIEEVIGRLGMDPEQYRWYTELRRFGTAPHGGFGLGFERLISWIGGWDNIRECIPAPRWKGRCIL